MKKSKSYIRKLIKKSLNENFGILPVLFYGAYQKSKQFTEQNPELASVLTHAGFDEAISQNMGTLGDFIEFKVEATVGKRHMYANNTLDKYFHSLGFCIATMESTIDACRRFIGFRKMMIKKHPDNEAVQQLMIPTRDEVKKEILRQVKETLKNAGTWKESFFDHALGLGSADIDDLAANEFGMSLAFNPNWRKIIYEKYVPTVKPEFFKAFISKEEYISKTTGKKVNPHFRYALGSDSPYYTNELEKAKNGKNFKFIAPPYNINVSEKERLKFIWEEELVARTGGFELDKAKIKKFNKYISFDYIKALEKAL